MQLQFLYMYICHVNRPTVMLSILCKSVHCRWPSITKARKTATCE